MSKIQNIKPQNFKDWLESFGLNYNHKSVEPSAQVLESVNPGYPLKAEHDVASDRQETQE